MWDEEDGFYYDLVRLADGSATGHKVRSMVWLLPLAVTTVIEKSQREGLRSAADALLRRKEAPRHKGLSRMSRALLDRGSEAISPRFQMKSMEAASHRTLR